MIQPRLVVRYLTGINQILGVLSKELVLKAPPQLGPMDFGDHSGIVILDRKTPTYFLYREVPNDTLESGESHVV